jgi:hypothetical protein
MVERREANMKKKQSTSIRRRESFTMIKNSPMWADHKGNMNK